MKIVVVYPHVCSKQAFSETYSKHITKQPFSRLELIIRLNSSPSAYQK